MLTKVETFQTAQRQVEMKAFFWHLSAKEAANHGLASDAEGIFEVLAEIDGIRLGETHIKTSNYDDALRIIFEENGGYDLFQTPLFLAKLRDQARNAAAVQAFLAAR